MFIVTPKDIKILNVQDPDDRNKQISILQYSGHAFRLAQLFGDSRDRAVNFSRHLTENMGKLCVLLEEPHLFSVWEEVKIDQYQILPDVPNDDNLHQSVNGSQADVQIASASSATTAYLPQTPSVEPEEPEEPMHQSKLPLLGDRQDEEPDKRRISYLAGENRQKAIALGLILLAATGVASLGWHLLNSSPNPIQVEISPAKLPLDSIDTSLPNPKVLHIDGGSTMVGVIRRLRNAYTDLNPNIPTTYGQPDGHPSGSNQGLDDLLNNPMVALVASDRPLKPKHAEAGVQVVAIARDAIAVAVGKDNPFKGELTLDQLRQIYQRKITNWAELGGPNMPIRVINRAKTSGTRDIFQNVVLEGQEFASESPNFITWSRDETTDIVKVLGNNGIYYATISQLKNQELVRIVAIDGAYPADPKAVQSGKYPLSRNLYLAFPKPTSPAVKEFIDIALSPQGQQIVQQAGFIPLR